METTKGGRRTRGEALRRRISAVCSRSRGSAHPEGCGVPQNGTPRDTVNLHRRPPPASTGYCSSTVDVLQPPPATVHPRAPVHPASTALLHRLLFNQPSSWALVQPPLHGLLFVQPSTVYCSSSPPSGHPVHPSLHRVLFIQPQPARSIGVLFIQRQCHGSCSSTPTAHCSSKPPRNAHCSSREAASIGFS